MDQSVDNSKRLAQSNSSDKKTDEKQEPKSDTPSNYGYFALYRYSDSIDMLLIIFGIIGAAVNGLTLPAFTLFFGDLVNTLGKPENAENLTDDVNEIAVRFVILAVVAWISSYFEVGFWMWSGSRQASTIRLRYLEAVLKQDVTYFDRDQTSGALLQGLNDDTLTVQQALGEKVGNCIHHIATFVGGMIIAFYRGWQLTLVIMAVIPLIAVCGYFIAKIVGSAQSQLSDAYADANQVAQSAISNVRTVAAFNGEEKTMSKYEAMLQWPMKLGIKINIYNGVAIGAINVVIFGAYGLALWYGSELVIESQEEAQKDNTEPEFQGGDVLNVIFAAIIGGFSLGQAAPNLQYFAKGVVSGNKIFSIIEREPEVRSPSNAITYPKTNGKIELKSVKFVYPARPDCGIFDDLSLVIPSGKTVALVGQSGSGKSTVVQLIERFYDPMEGQVLLDDTDIRHLDLQWYRDQIGLVSQEPTLFATSIRENILYGSPNSSEEDMIQAAKAANAYRFITHLPKQFDTQVGERGVQLSGGQKQRIAIARAILKNPKIMLLDEATSALDTQSERLVQEALDNMIIGRTTVVIAHRLSTIRNADIIAVVQEGAIVEQGSHDELILKEAGAYQTLVKLQQQHVEEEQPQQQLKGDVDEIILVKTEEDSREKRGSLDVLKNIFSGSADSRHNIDQSSKNAVELQTISEKQQILGDPAADSEEEERVKKVPMTRLWQYNKTEWPFAIVGSLASVGLGAAMPVFSIALTKMLGVYFLEDADKQREEARKWALIFFAIGLGWLIFSVAQQYCFGVMGQLLAKRIRVVLMKSILKQEIGWFDKDENSSGNISSRLSTDTLYVRGAVGDALGLLVQNIVTILAGFVIAYVTYWRMALVITAVFPLLAFSSYIQTKFLMGFSSSAEKLLAGANQVASESITSVRVVQAYNMQLSIVELYSEMMSVPSKTMRRQSHVIGVLFGFSFFIIFCTYALAFWYGGQEVEKENIDLEQMFRVFFAILLGAMGAANAQMQFPDIGKAGAAVERVFGVVDRVPLIKDSENASEGKSVEGAIELRDVEFSYPQRLSVKVFKQFNLTVQSGQTVAMVGESGSGKSTVVGLIERFYIPQSGVVMLDGVDIQSLKMRWLRDQIGLVSQEPILFSMSVAENIKYGCEDATPEQVREAARIANAADFVEKLPEQYDTQVGEQGVQLSGGQKQRVAIARAVIKNPKILLLDEATSALDAESEKVVQDALDKIMDGRTTIVIAHRLSTIRNADKIAVVNKGSIAEQGTHDQLMTIHKGLYRQMVRAQNQRK